MTSKTYLSVFGNDDKKHDLERKFGYKYRALESVYPNASKLPDDEIQKAIDVFYEGDANEDTDVMLNRVKDYTTKNEPIWKEKYFNPKPKLMQTSVSQPLQTINPQPQMPSLSVKQPLKGFGDYMAENVADMVYGADRALSGATFGGYDWLKRKTGIGVNERDYLNMKRYNEGTDKFAKIGGTISEIGGNIIGGGRGLVNGLQKAGLKGFPLASTTGAIGGGLYGLTNSNKLNEVPYNTTLGAVSGGALGGLADVGINKLSRAFMKRIFNVPQNTTKQETYNNFIKNNASDEMLDFTPSREQIIKYIPDTKFSIPKTPLSYQQSENILKNSALKSNINIGGNIEHYIGKADRGQYVGTLYNTLNSPDIRYSKNVLNSNGNVVKRDYLVKKYNGLSENGEYPFFDFVIMEDGKLYNKFKPKKLEYISNQLNEGGPLDVSLTSRLMSAEPTHGHLISHTNNIPLRSVVVNPNIKNISKIYEGLNGYQAGSLDAAIEIGASRSSQKVGSLEHITKVIEAIDDMQQNPSININNMQELKVIKNRMENVLQNKLQEVLKPYNRYENFYQNINDNLPYLYPSIGNFNYYN